MSPTAALALRAHRENVEQQKAILGVALTGDDLVFGSIEGEPLSPGTVSHASLDIAGRTGLHGIRFHDLRHTHATLMLKQEVHPTIVQERLGHSTIAITLDTYNHVVPGLQEAAALRFDEGLERKKTANQPVSIEPVFPQLGQKCDAVHHQLSRFWSLFMNSSQAHQL